MRLFRWLLLALGLGLLLLLFGHVERAIKLDIVRRADFGQPLWPPKEMHLGQLQKQATFPLVLPQRDVHRYPVLRAQLNWLAQDTLGEHTLPSRQVRAQLNWLLPDNSQASILPSRQAACVYFRLSRGDVAAVVQVKAQAGASLQRRNVYQAVGQGYFFGNPTPGTWHLLGKAGNTDYLIVSKAPFDELKVFQGTLGVKGR